MLLLGAALASLVIGCSDEPAANAPPSEQPDDARDDEPQTPSRSDSDGGTSSSESGTDEPGERGSEVASTFREYCEDIAVVWCEREQDCPDGAAAECELGFVLGCCERSNVCEASFGAGISNDTYAQCIEDTANDECGAGAPESCRALVTEAPEPSGPPDTLAAACSASCDAQAATGCAGGATLGECIYGCLAIPEFIPGCTDAWIDLNTCMAVAPLICDTVNGGAAVKSEDCGPELDAFGTCQ